MIEIGQCLTLDLKSAGQFVVPIVTPAPDQFDRDLLLVRIVVPHSEIDGTIPPAARARVIRHGPIR